MASGITGIDQVAENLNGQLIRIQAGSIQGLRAAVSYIRKDMDTTPPLIPIDKGKLRASWYQRTVKAIQGPAVVFGLSANYALYVHEREPGAPWGDDTVGEIKWSRTGSGPKFLEASMKRNTEKVMLILKRHME